MRTNNCLVFEIVIKLYKHCSRRRRRKKDLSGKEKTVPPVITSPVFRRYSFHFLIAKHKKIEFRRKKWKTQKTMLKSSHFWWFMKSECAGTVLRSDAHGASTKPAVKEEAKAEPKKSSEQWSRTELSIVESCSNCSNLALKCSKPTTKRSKSLEIAPKSR